MTTVVAKKEVVPPEVNPELEAEKRANANTLQMIRENIDVIQATLSYLMRTGTSVSARTLADLALWHAREIENLIASRQPVDASGDELPF